MNSTYRMFPHQGSPIKTAIANTLSFLDDEVTAQRTYEGFDNHRLVRDDRTILLHFVPTLIRELTEGQYNAQLLGVIDIHAVTKQLVTHYDGQAPDLAELISSEIQARNIVNLPPNHSLSLDDAEIPSICVFKAPKGAAPLVYLGDQVQIGDQVHDWIFADGETLIQLDPKAYPVVGLLTIEDNY